MTRNEKGIALVLSLFLMAAMSVIAASLMFLSQTETYSSMNYRLMSQARYGAESGIQKTANFLVYGYTPPPGVAGADPLASFDTTGSPVKFGGAKVYLASASNCVGLAHNYPIQAVQDAFCAAAHGTLPSGTTTVSYATTATLLSMQQVKVYGGGWQTIQTWQITSDGTITAGKTATVEVIATIEMQKVPAVMYAAFATDAGCGALTFGGTSVVKSFDSSQYNPANGNSITDTNGGLTSSGGNVGTNGNLGLSGGATIDGTLSTPRVGVGGCSSGNVTELSSSGNANLCPDPTQPCSGIQTGAVVQLPQAMTMPAPTAPNPIPPTTDININSSTSCVDLGLTSPVCTGSAGALTINPAGTTIALGNVSLTGGANLTLNYGTYNVNSIDVSANSNLNIVTTTGNNVVMNVAGVGQTTPIDFHGTSLSNPSFNPAEFQMTYAGTGNVVLNGNSTAAAMVYAPNATATLNGSDGFYGSIVTSTLNVTGGANIFYDRRLSMGLYTVGNAMMSAFSWKKY